MELLFLGLAVGVIFSYLAFSRYAFIRKREKITTQSVVLMERIRSVCKFITVEGDFAEIYLYEGVKHKWLDLFIGKKKALILIEAKAHIGFDLTKIKMEPNTQSKTITLLNFPKPEVLTIETDLKYYDKKEGWLNPITSSDLTNINKEAKQHILDKIPSSGILDEASKQALETIQLMEKLAETISWKLDFSSLTISENNKKKSISKDVNK